MLDQDCLVKLSPIAGCGLFAGKLFRRGECVVDYSRDPWRLVLYTELTSAQLENLEFIGVTTTHCFVTDSDCEFMHVNHSATPNCDWLRDDMCLVANREIQQDEEITYDYTLEVKPSWLPKPKWAYQ